jgi:hypothetical protein
MHYVTEVEYQSGHRLLLTFGDGSRRRVDLAPHLDGEMFEPLRDIERFRTARLKSDIDTVVWDNGADMSPDVRQVTVEFFERYAARYELYGSDVLLRELAADPDSQRRELHFRVLKRHHVVILPMDSDDEVARLANAYLREGVVPERKRDDALREVWEWKDAVSRDMAELTTAEALRRIHAEAEGIGREYGLSRAMPYGKRLCVAEDRADYGRKNDEESTKA